MWARYLKVIKAIHIRFMMIAQRGVEHDKRSVVLGEENTLIETLQQVGFVSWNPV
jgi:hypothetical protein